MVETFTTSIGVEYVPDWGMKEAVRELMQNCLDAGGSISLRNNRMTLLNKNTVISKKALVLGVTTKRDDTSTVGQYGEGLKLAMLIFARENRTLSLLNGGTLWKPKIGKNEVGVQVLKVDIVPLPWQNSNLVVSFDLPNNINLETLYLGFHGRISHQACDYLIENFPSKLFSNGLSVGTIDSDFSYNLNGLSLGRDRNYAWQYEVERKVKRLWENLVAEDEEKYGRVLAELLLRGRGIEAEAFSLTTTTAEINRACVAYWEAMNPNSVPVTAGQVVQEGKSIAVPMSFHSGLGSEYTKVTKTYSRQQLWWTNYSHLLNEHIEAKKTLAALLGIVWEEEL